MSNSSSNDSETSESSESFEEHYSDFHGEFEETTFCDKSQAKPDSTAGDDVDEGAYQDEPIASAEWVEEYNERRKQTLELESELKKRLTGELPVSNWCRCGNCETKTLQNISECYCCTELDGCMESLESDWVQQEFAGALLVCVTQHPGFQPVCLQKWSLRMAADRLKTKAKKRYRQTGSEERFLRSIAYREFSRLVYGFLGAKRIPLPACAYVAIRTKFPVVVTSGEKFTGFDLDED